MDCPNWLAKRIAKAGGSVSFYKYMDWVLNDSQHGAYSRGHLKLGIKGDFVTSPTLGPDFAELLAVQLADWIEQLHKTNNYNLPISLIEVGPGEGDLAKDLIFALNKISSNLISNLELILVDRNEGMITKQKNYLSSLEDVPVRWSTFDKLSTKPVLGIIIAHEMLDALPVERLVFTRGKLFRQGVTINIIDNHPILEVIELPLTKKIQKNLIEIRDTLGIEIPPESAPDGWSTELHSDLNTWFRKASKILTQGSLLIIDYALEANRYYSCSRSSGTLMSYKNQVASSQFFNDPGYWDLTSHLCLETLQFYAKKHSWDHLGSIRQGQALLALGLSNRLHSLQSIPGDQLDIALSRRETLLRLVDPLCLGEFRWIGFEKKDKHKPNNAGLNSKFLANSPLQDLE